MRERTRWVLALAAAGAALVLVVALTEGDSGGGGDGSLPATSLFDCVKDSRRLDACRPLAPPGARDGGGRFVSCRATGKWKVRRGSRERKRIALTFDDGPSPFTHYVLDVLSRHKVRATFFVVGTMIPGRRRLLRETLARGNEIGNHSWAHGILTRRGANATRDMRATNAAIEAATGFRPCTFRPPYGLVDSRLVRRAHELGMTTVMWTTSSEDYLGEAGAVVAQRALLGTRAGSIVLMHDGGGSTRIPTVHALSRVIRKLKKRGYELVTVSQLLRQPVLFGP